MGPDHDLSPILAELETMPDLLRSAAARLDEAQARRPGAGGGFSLVEQAWHLADLEREGFAVRIERLLTQTRPRLPDFEGARLAVEREYRAKSLRQGIETFAAARAGNLATVRGASPEALAREGEQAGVGRVTLGDIPRLMLEHDRSHRQEIAALLPVLSSKAMSA